MARLSLINVLNPKPNSTILIYDVHASESGALAILNDLYNQIVDYKDYTVKWVFIVSTPYYTETANIIVRRYPWIKKNWGFRYYFNKITTRLILKEFNPDKVFSLQNEGITFFKKEQLVYLHLPFILTDHVFSWNNDGKKLWLYQNILSKIIFKSLRKVDYTIVQTKWMKEALIKKGKIKEEHIIILQPDITSNNIKKYIDSKIARKSFFYPATAFTYKNHWTLLKAVKYAQDNGLLDYNVQLTISANENNYTKALYAYSTSNQQKVFFSGPIPREQVFEKYANSILLFPSYIESFGLPLLEARMTGTFIIASDTPYSREILAGYKNVAFFAELDYQTMGKEMLKLQAND